MYELKLTYSTDNVIFIEDLYYGEIRPCEERGVLSENMKAAERDLTEIMEKIMTESPGLTELYEERMKSNLCLIVYMLSISSEKGLRWALNSCRSE